MYYSNFASDVENMMITLHNFGKKMIGMDYFFKDFDRFCVDKYPDATLLTPEIAEGWIHNATSESKKHMQRRVLAMKHLGTYQFSLGKSSYVPNYAIKPPKAEEPRLFSDNQLAEFFEKVDSGVRTTPTFPHNDLIFPVLFRLIYCCGLRSSEACNIKIGDIDFARGTIDIYRGKNLVDRRIFMSDDICALCLRFNEYYSKLLPNRTYFFQPSSTRDCYKSSETGSVFDMLLKKTSFSGAPGKKFTQHGLRHLFAVQNIRKCAEQGEDFGNWMQFLCKYMGHKTIQSTQYYLHITSQLFPVYSEKLKLLEEGIGVVYVQK